MGLEPLPGRLRLDALDRSTGPDRKTTNPAGLGDLPREGPLNQNTLDISLRIPRRTVQTSVEALPTIARSRSTKTTNRRASSWL